MIIIIFLLSYMIFFGLIKKNKFDFYIEFYINSLPKIKIKTEIKTKNIFVVVL